MTVVSRDILGILLDLLFVDTLLRPDRGGGTVSVDGFYFVTFGYAVGCTHVVRKQGSHYVWEHAFRHGLSTGGHALPAIS